MLEMLEVSVATFAVMLLAALTWLYGASRELAETRGQCDESWLNLERLLRRRDDALAPFLVVCEGALGEREDLLRALADARQRAGAARTPVDRARASREISAALTAVLETALRQPRLPEGFPEAKAHLEEIEEQLAHWSEIYNAAAARWNAHLGKLPDKIVAKLEKAGPRDPWNVPLPGGSS